MTQTLSPVRRSSPANGRRSAGGMRRAISQEIAACRAPAPLPESVAPSGPTVREIPLDAIDVNPNNVREQASMEPGPLAATLKQLGVLQPINVRRKGQRWELISGERRLHAARAAKLRTITAIERDWSDDVALLAMMVENVSRKNLNPVEKARGIAKLMDPADAGGAGKTMDDVRRLFAKSESWVVNTLRVLKLPDIWQRRLVRGEINERQARALIAHTGDAALLARIERDMQARPECWQTAAAFEASVKFIVAHGDAAVDAPRPKIPAAAKAKPKASATAAGGPSDATAIADGDEGGRWPTNAQGDPPVDEEGEDDEDGEGDEESAADADEPRPAARAHVALSEAEFQHVLDSMAAGAEMYDQMANADTAGKATQARYAKLNALTHRVLKKLHGAASIRVETATAERQ